MGVWAVRGDEHVAAAGRIHEETERGSDRAVAILVGSLIETYLADHIKLHIVDPKGSIWKDRGRPSGPFGSFAVKIDLAYMLGLITAEARSDLINIKEIRNYFAHDLNARGFADDLPKARSMNLELVQYHVPSGEGLPPPTRPGRHTVDFYIQGDGRPWEEIHDPRKRFIWTGQVFSFALGHSDGKQQPGI
jgi:hypothetical protein